jgi:hypothetical protein
MPHRPCDRNFTIPLIFVIWIIFIFTINNNAAFFYLIPSLYIVTVFFHALKQCFGSVPFWYGSGSGSFSLVTFKMPTKDCKFFFLLNFLKVHLHHSSQIKIMKKSQNSRNQGFSYYFCLMMEKSGSESESRIDPDPRGPETYKSCMRIRIWFRNTE